MEIRKGFLGEAASELGPESWGPTPQDMQSQKLASLHSKNVLRRSASGPEVK